MGTCIFKDGSKTCGRNTEPLSQYCWKHQPEIDNELTLRSPFPERWGDETGVGEGSGREPGSAPKIK